MINKPARYARIMRTLRSRIIRGVYKGKIPGERALAEEFDTSPKTVMMALVQLETQGLVRRSTRQGTFVTFKGGHPNGGPIVYARLVLEDPIFFGRSNLWAGMIICGFQKAAQEHKVSMVLEYSGSIDEAVENAVRESREPGCIGTCMVGADLEMRHGLRLAEASGPMVLGECNFEEPVVPSVSFDHLDAGRRAAEHLLKLGHRRIAMARLEPVSLSGNDREVGAANFLQGHGLKLSSRRGPVNNPLPMMGALFRESGSPTAVITGGTPVGEFLMAFAASGGIRVPQDLSVITFGDVRQARVPAISMIAWDYAGLGRHLFEMLLDEDLRREPRCALLPAKLVDNGTTAPPAAT